MGTITLITCAVVGFKSNTSILSNSFLLLETIGTMSRGKEEILSRGLVKIALNAMFDYQDNDSVLAASMGMLLLACEDDEGLAQMISSNGVATALNAMKHLVNKAELQQRGLEFMRKLSLSHKGAKILDGIKGSWQWLAQGTESGNALIHLLPGNLQSKGWAMGDINEKDVMHKGTLYSDDFKDGKSLSTSMWTAANLKRYMGLNQKELQLASNKSEIEYYFKTIRDLGLLPRVGEKKEYWFIRVKRFEEKNGINIDELVKRNQIRLFGGGVMEEDVVTSKAGEEDGSDDGARPSPASKRKPAASPHRSRKHKEEEAKEPLHETRAVFLEGVKSSGWISAPGSFQSFGDDRERGGAGGGRRQSLASMPGGGGGRRQSVSADGGANDDLDDNEEDEGKEGEDEEDRANDGEGGEEDDDEDFDDTRSMSSMSSKVSFTGVPNIKGSDSSFVVRSKPRRSKNDISLGKPIPKVKKFIGDMNNRLAFPEKRREVFKTQYREQLYIPLPLEQMYPEVIGTHMESRKHATERLQLSIAQDPYNFGKTKEELAAIAAAADFL